MGVVYKLENTFWRDNEKMRYCWKTSNSHFKNAEILHNLRILSHLDWIRRDKTLHGRTDLYVLEMHYTADKPLCRWGKYSPDPVYQVMKSKYEMYTMPIANYIMTLTRAAAIIRCWNLRRKFPGEADLISIGIMHDKRSW